MNRLNRNTSGFTLVELMLGVTMMAMVVAAITTLTFAVSRQWQNDEAAQARAVSGAQTVSRISAILREAKYVGGVVRGAVDNTSTDTACVLFWRSDRNSDSSIQMDEASMLEFDKTNHTLLLYAVSWPSSWSQAQIDASNPVLDPTEFGNATSTTTFKTLPYVTSRVIATDVNGVEFVSRSPATTSARPVMDFVVNLGDSSEATTQFGSVTLRPPTQQPRAPSANNSTLITTLLSTVSATTRTASGTALNKATASTN